VADIWAFLLLCKINIFLYYIHFHLYFTAPPMIPSTHTRFYPRCIFNGARRIQTMNKLCFDELSRMISYQNNTPRRSHFLKEASFHSIFLLSGQWRKSGSQYLISFLRTVTFSYVKSRIIINASFGLEVGR
jgi:hypothetical protein